MVSTDVLKEGQEAIDPVRPRYAIQKRKEVQKRADREEQDE
jgi:hypothetical protein